MYRMISCQAEKWKYFTLTIIQREEHRKDYPIISHTGCPSMPMKTPRTFHKRVGESATKCALLVTACSRKEDGRKVLRRAQLTAFYRHSHRSHCSSFAASGACLLSRRLGSDVKVSGSSSSSSSPPPCASCIQPEVWACALPYLSQPSPCALSCFAPQLLISAPNLCLVKSFSSSVYTKISKPLSPTH